MTPQLPTCSEVVATTHPALQVLLELEAAGLTVTVNETEIRVHPAGRVTVPQATVIRQWRLELMDLIRCCHPTVVERRQAFAAQWSATTAPHVPAFVFRPGAADALEPGHCCSCGDETGLTSTAQCRPCALAWRAVVGLVPALEPFVVEVGSL
jgi:hypothetical protein